MPIGLNVIKAPHHAGLFLNEQNERPSSSHRDVERMMILLPPFGVRFLRALQKFYISLALVAYCFVSALSGANAAPSPEALKQARQQCSRMAEKLANARKLQNNSVQSSSNYNLDKETCFAQIEISQILKSTGEGESEAESDGEKRHRQILLINATTNEILAIVMWEEPKGLRVGHIYDPKYDGPRDDYEKVDIYMRKKMALNMR
jgi:hypothetical protein